MTDGISADSLVADGWKCLRVHPRQLRPHDVMLPMKFPGFKIVNAFQVQAVDGGASHRTRFLGFGWTKWGALLNSDDRAWWPVVLRKPEDEPAPEPADYNAVAGAQPATGDR